MKMKNTTLGVILIALITMLNSCSENETAPPKGQTAVPVILDMDLGSSTDDLFAMELLLKDYDTSNFKLKGIVCDRMGEQNAEVADIFRTYHNHPEIPIGLERNGVLDPMIYVDYAPVLDSLSAPDGSAMFRRTLSSYSNLPDGYQLYRQLLSQAEDNSVVIISCGFVTSLAHLLTSQADEYSSLDGKSLVRKKVKAMYIQGGVFDSEYNSEPDYNFKQAATFSRTFFNEWPQEVPVVFNPMETGQNVDYAWKSVIADISWTDANPIKQVYKNCNCDTGQRMWDVMNVLCLLDGEAPFHLSSYGTVQLNDDFTTTFTPDPSGHQRYMGTFTTAEAENILNSIREKVRQR